MTARVQRLIMIIISFTLVVISATIVLINYKDNIVFFYSPSELKNLNFEINDKLRIGGVIKKDSIIKKEDGSITFILTDNKSEIVISYFGIIPNLFREEQGAVVEGILEKNNKFKAERIFAKHDENYMPASIKKQLEENDYWKKKY